jgi:ABC-2 type transport system permease protein
MDSSSVPPALSRLPRSRYAGLTLHYLAQIVKTRLAYRGDILVQCAASLAIQASGIFVVLVIFDNIPLLEGWSRSEVFFVYGFAVTAQALFEMFADGFYWFADKYVIRAELDRILLRPLHPLFQILLENFSLESLPDLILGGAILALASSALGIAPGPLDILILLVLLASAVLVLAGIFLALASVAFWVEDKVGVLPPIYNLSAFARYPVTIYHPLVRFLLTWVLPYAFVAFYPSTRFLGRGEFDLFQRMTPLAGATSIAVGLAVFHAGLRRYRSAGS